MLIALIFSALFSAAFLAVANAAWHRKFSMKLPSQRDRDRARTWHRKLLVRYNGRTKLVGLMLMWVMLTLAGSVARLNGPAIFWIAAPLGIAGWGLYTFAGLWNHLYAKRRARP